MFADYLSVNKRKQNVVTRLGVHFVFIRKRVAALKRQVNINGGVGIRAVVLNFWYTECSACKTEFPALERAYKAYADTVSVVALDSLSKK